MALRVLASLPGPAPWADLSARQNAAEQSPPLPRKLHQSRACSADPLFGAVRPRPNGGRTGSRGHGPPGPGKCDSCSRSGGPGSDRRSLAPNVQLPHYLARPRHDLVAPQLGPPSRVPGLLTPPSYRAAAPAGARASARTRTAGGRHQARQRHRFRGRLTRVRTSRSDGASELALFGVYTKSLLLELADFNLRLDHPPGGERRPPKPSAHGLGSSSNCRLRSVRDRRHNIFRIAADASQRHRLPDPKPV